MEERAKIETIRTWLGTGSINIFGRPFAGKDTQAGILAEQLDGVVLGGGDILRNSVIPEHVKAHMHAGSLVPIEDYVNIVLPFLKQEQFKHHPLILSSVGRWHGEEEGVLEATEEAGHPVKVVIYLDLEENIVEERWQASHELADRGDRHDDTLEVLEHRLEEYRNKTLPVIEYYKQQGLLVTIPANLTPAEVHARIIDALHRRATEA
ncbi:nucleoside monophosphate kinase [Candidatus Saccharibacteria bacterium]|nr:nucleoside monophosphate kinase [Candidatus Saccharibacteria bacterium]